VTVVRITGGGWGCKGAVEGDRPVDFPSSSRIEPFMVQLWKFAFLAFCAGAGAYLGSYLKRKGENLATHEDISQLVTQVRAVTTATKEIEAKISDEVWDRQKRWELKREVLFEATKQTAILKDKLTALHGFYQTEKISTLPSSTERHEKRVRVTAEFNGAANDFQQATMLVGLVCGEELERSLLLFVRFASHLAETISNGQPEAFMTSTKELAAHMNALLDAMRKELEL
jgi:hypothetical protein